MVEGDPQPAPRQSILDAVAHIGEEDAEPPPRPPQPHRLSREMANMAKAGIQSNLNLRPRLEAAVVREEEEEDEVEVDDDPQDREPFVVERPSPARGGPSVAT
ncbi:hypothetical protein SAPIO_CDS3445 [Scedosporium apiospermum]|uniref:Uncharacterized protein n=1 Tax=Pseudallescheria apiosperma TaxID=563466 RepID=A0A084GAS9_PSEDA|nr:uncharacterized protein SAPIO_CDS3445 [Scedosporium apiospermum]KEZ44441.1 hypothetical protein SAPIO_CDS3445 [Scedosporium apiospermum]